MNELNVFAKILIILKKYKLIIYYSIIIVVTLPLDKFNHRK